MVTYIAALVTACDYNLADRFFIQVELAQQMGGTPMEIWADREYWGEANAMLYLRDRIARESFQCSIFSRIKRYIELYAKNYEKRFVEIAQSTSPPYRCTWQ